MMMNADEIYSYTKYNRSDAHTCNIQIISVYIYLLIILSSDIYIIYIFYIIIVFLELD